MATRPFNKHFWLALVAILFAGGLVYGQAVGLNDAIDRAGTSIGTATVLTPERVEIRHIDMDLRALSEEPLEDDFSDVDAALKEL